MGKKRSYIDSFFLGLARLANVWPREQVKGYQHKDELAALRRDTQRIGDDMRKVIARPVQGDVDMADVRKKVMARHSVVRSYLAKK